MRVFLAVCVILTFPLWIKGTQCLQRAKRRIHRSGQEEFLVYLHLTNSANGQRPPKMQTYKTRGENWSLKEFQEEMVRPWRQLALFPHQMHWHANDHRQLFNAKWLWMELRGQREERSTKLLDQSGANVAEHRYCSQEPSRRLSRLGPSTGHVLLTESHMNYYISFYYLTSWFITDRQLSFKRSTMLRDLPPDTPRERERENLCILQWKGWRMDKTTLSVDLKRRLIAGMKKNKEMCF